MKAKGLIIAGVAVLVVGLVFGGITIGGYNSLVKQDETTSSNYAQIENLLKARHDKITELLGVVQAEIGQEAAIYAAITAVRDSYATSPSGDAGEITAFNNLLAVIEDNQPNFMSESGFRSLMDEISEAENKLEIGRKDFNESVRSYNTSIKLFPTNMVAGMFGLNKEKEYWSVSPTDTEMPSISFNFSSINS